MLANWEIASLRVATIKCVAAAPPQTATRAERLLALADGAILKESLDASRACRMLMEKLNSLNTHGNFKSIALKRAFELTMFMKTGKQPY